MSESDAAVVGGYTVIDRLGSGGMGMVYLARSASGRRVAVKLVHAQYAEDREFRVRFRQELAAARRVSGAFTAPVVDADPEAERPWMATLYVPGPTLAQRVAQGGPLAGAELRTLGLGLVEALRDIHRAGVVHRDLKPANVLMAEDGPRVIDFGISRAGDGQSLTTTGRVFGTPPYMSPEQLNSAREVGPASDVFALASVLVFAACGRGPFDAASPYASAYGVVHEPPVLDGVPEPLRSIAARCLAKDPGQRPGAAELMSLLQTLPGEDAAAGGGDPYGAAGPATRAWDVAGGGAAEIHQTPPKRRAALLASLTVALALAGVGMAVALWPGQTGAGAAADPAASPSPTPSPGLPKGWRPWQTALQAKTPLYGSSDSDSGCLASAGALYCGGEGVTAARLDPATGTVGWRFSAGVESTTPLVVRDGVVVVNDLKGPAWSTDKRQWVTAVATDSGESRWTHSVAMGSDPVGFGKWVVAPSVDDRTLIAMNTGDGTTAWRFPVPAGDTCRPWAGGRQLFALCFPADARSLEGTLWRFDPTDGEAREVGAVPYYAQPAGVDDGELVLLKYPVDVTGAAGAYSSVLRVDTKTGKSHRVALPQQGGVTRDAPVRLIGGTLYLVRADGLVTAVSARTGKMQWRRDTQVENLSAPVLSEKYRALYFVNGHGRLLALGRAAGQELWRAPAREGARTLAEAGPPQVYLRDDAVVALTGNVAFSVSPTEPDATAQ